MRTFIAIELPPELHPAIEQAQRTVARALSAACAQYIRWTPKANFHVTLRFLGATQPDQAAKLAAALAQIADSHGVLKLAMDGSLGCYPTTVQPSVLWLSLDGDLSALYALQAATEAAAVAVGFVAESRSFSPHLTIGRVVRSATAAHRRKLGDALAQLAAASPQTSSLMLPMISPLPPAFSITEVVHMASDLRPSGAVYTVLGRYPLTMEP